MVWCIYRQVRLTRIAAHDFLSFHDVDLPVGPGLTAITGPNGAGKTSLARAVDLVAKALLAHWTQQWGELDAAYHSAGRFYAERWWVRIGVELDDGEVALVELWLRGCLLGALGQNNDSQTLAAQQLVLDAADIGADEMFRRGFFEVGYNGEARRPWRLAWIGEASDGNHIRLSMETNVARAGNREGAPTQFAQALRDRVLGAQEAAGLPRGLDQTVPENFVFPTAAELARHGGIELVMRLLNSWPVEPYPIRFTFDRLAISGPEATHKLVGYAPIASNLLAANVLISSNSRVAPKRLWAMEELATTPELGSGDGLALALFQSKNSEMSSVTFRRTCDLFEQLMGDRETLDVSVSVEDATETQPARLLITPSIDTHRGYVPLHLAGAGRGEVAHLALLLSQTQPVLILDEPATNLSAAAQRRVVTVLGERSARGNQTVLITHSTPLVPTNLDEIVRLTPRDGGTAVTRPGRHPFVKKHADLLRLVPVRDALFASGVFLTEGETELAALNVWLAQAKPTLEEAGVLLIDVRGDTGLVPHMRLFDALEIPWVALADGPAFEMRLHLYNEADMKPTLAEAKKYWEPKGVFTMATTFGTGDNRGMGEFEEYLKSVSAEALKAAKQASGGSKPRTGEHFAMHVPLPDAVQALWTKALLHLGSR